MLLQNGADVNVGPAEVDGRTALQAAAARGHTDIVGMLLQKGTDVNARPADNRGRTALQAAAEKGYTGIVGILSQESAKGGQCGCGSAKGNGG